MSLRLSMQTVTISLSVINHLVYVIRERCVFCAVLTEFLSNISLLHELRLQMDNFKSTRYCCRIRNTWYFVLSSQLLKYDWNDLVTLMFFPSQIYRVRFLFTEYNRNVNPLTPNGNYMYQPF
jgi:hypothetical protein